MCCQSPASVKVVDRFGVPRGAGDEPDGRVLMGIPQINRLQRTAEGYLLLTSAGMLPEAREAADHTEAGRRRRVRGRELHKDMGGTCRGYMSCREPPTLGADGSEHEGTAEGLAAHALRW
mgnify:CR=1 FL=1